MRKCERKTTRPLTNASEFRMRQWVGYSRTIALVAKPASRIPFVTSEWREHFKMLGCRLLEENRLAGICALWINRFLRILEIPHPKPPFSQQVPLACWWLSGVFPHILLILEHKIGCFVVVSMVFPVKVEAYVLYTFTIFFFFSFHTYSHPHL